MPGTLLLVLLLYVAGSAGSSPSTTSLSVEALTDGQSFPLSNLSVATGAAALSAWIGHGFAVNFTGGGMVDPSGRGFADAYNMSVPFGLVVYQFASPAGDTILLYYCEDTSEFIAFEMRFSTPRPLDSVTLYDYSRSSASVLGMPLLNASYSEYALPVFYEPNPNGTGESPHSQVMASWREAFTATQVDFANQLQVMNDVTAGGVTFIRGFRWMVDPPKPGYSSASTLEAASRAINASFGNQGNLASSLIAVAPNYVNMTWSFYVELNYGDSGTFTLWLDAQDLTFQGVATWAKPVPSAEPHFFPWSASVLVLVASAIVLAAFALAWFGRSEATMLLAGVSLIVPLVARLKRESVLDHFLRGRIVEYVSLKPGTTFSELKRKFGVANGVLSYHLWVLARTGFIRLTREGSSARYYAAGSTAQGGVLLSSFQYAVLRAVFVQGGAHLVDLSREMNSSRQRVHYNVKALARLGLLELTKSGGELAIALSPGGEELIRQGGFQGSPGNPAYGPTLE